MYPSKNERYSLIKDAYSREWRVVQILPDREAILKNIETKATMTVSYQEFDGIFQLLNK